MSFCPNLSDPTVNKEFNELVAATNKNLAYYIWDLNGGNFLDKNLDGSANTEFTALLNTVGRFDAIKQTADKILKEDSTSYNIKPGVQELFESNPELANQVYEALGVGSSIVGKKWAEVVKNPRVTPAMYRVRLKNYEATLKRLEEDNYTLPRLKTEDLNKIESEEKLEELKYKSEIRLNNAGTVIYAPSKITPQQKQQALQLYSQYLDSIFPDSKVKEIVYHLTDTKFDDIKLGRAGLLYFTGASNIDAWKQIYKNTTNQDFTYTIPYVIDTDWAEILEEDRVVTDTIFYNPEKTVYEKRGLFETTIDAEKKAVRLGSKQDIEGFKRFVATTAQLNNLFGVDENNIEFHLNTINVVSNFLEKIGIEQRLVPEFLAADGSVVKGAIAAANFIEGTVDIIDDLEKRPDAWNKLPEEAAHWWYRLLKEDAPLKKLLWESGRTKDKRTDLFYNTSYGNLEGITSPEDLTEEAIGQLVAEAIKRIEQKNGSKEDYSFFKKFVEWLNKMLSIFKNTDTDPFEVAAMKLLSSDMSDLMTYNEYKNLFPEQPNLDMSEEGKKVLSRMDSNTYKSLMKRLARKKQMPREKTVQNLKNLLSNSKLSTKKLTEDEKNSLGVVDYLPSLVSFEKFDQKYKKGVPVKDALNIEGAKGFDLYVYNAVRESLLSTGDYKGIIPYNDFVNFTYEFLKNNYLLSFQELSGKWENYRIGFTFLDTTAKHRKIGLRFNDEYFTAGSHFAYSPLAWGNITYFKSNPNLSEPDSVLIHEIQNDFWERIRGSATSNETFALESLLKLPNLFRDLPENNVDLAFDNFKAKIEEKKGLGISIEREDVIIKRRKERISDLKFNLKKYIDITEEELDSMYEDISSGRPYRNGRFKYVLGEHGFVFINLDPESFRKRPASKAQLKLLLNLKKNNLVAKKIAFETNNLINDYRAKSIATSTFNYDKLTKKQFTDIYNNIQYNKDFYKDIVNVENKVKDKEELYEKYFTPLIHHLLQTVIEEKGKNFNVYFPTKEIVLLSQVQLPDTKSLTPTADLYAGEQDVKNGKVKNIGPMYNRMKKVNGVKLEYLENIDGFVKPVDGYKINLSNYNYKAPLLFGIKEEKEQTPTLDSPQKLDNAIKVSHSLITARIITNEGLEGAKVLINSYPNYTQYVELLGDFGKRFTETEKRKIYVGNRKYIQSFIPEFLTLEEDEVLSKNANDMLESNKINPEDMASYVVKLAVSALPKLNLEGQLEVKDKMPVAEDYKATMDYLYKKLANKFTLQEQVDTLTKASIKKPSLRLINRWFKLDKPIETKEDLQNKIALFSTFANADTTFITAIIDQDAFKYVIPKTSLEESYYDRWKSNMTNSDFVYFNATTGSYMLNVKELTKAVEKKEGVKYVVDGLAFLKATGYPDPMPELVEEAKKIASFLTSLKEDININKIFDKEGLKINKELKALVQKTIEVNDYQETTNVVDINNNGRYSIGIPTAYDLMIGYYKNNDVEFLALDNNNLVKEIKAGNVTVYNLFNYKNSQNIASEFDKLDKGSMAVTYYNFVMDNIYPVMPSGDRGSEYALKIDWQSDNTPSIKNLRNLYLDNLDYMSLAEGSTNYGSLFAPVIEILGNSTDATEIDLMLEEFIGEEAANAEQFFAEVAPEYYKKNKDKLDFEEFITRYYYSLVQQSALFTGNVQNYKDPFKRFTTFTSTRSAMANDDSINAAINEHYKRLDKKKADGYIKTLVFKDIEMSFPEMNKAFGLTAEEYKKDSEVYDGAGVLTIDEAREILIKADKWNEDLDKWYAYEAGLTEELPEVGAPIYKLISTGPLYNEDNTPYKDINVPHIYKSAYFVLSPRNATGVLKDVYEKMVAKQVGLGVFKSGSKAQNIGINELNGEYDTIQNINYDFIGFNLDTSGLEKTYVTDGTQGRKLLITDLFGVDGTQRITTRKGIEPTKEYVKLLESKIHELDRLKRENFFEEIGVTKTPEGYKSIDNLEKLTERIESALLARKTSSVLENQVKEILGDEEKLVDALTERNKFENMIMAIYNTDVVKRKMPGEMFVQIPDLNNELKFYTKNAAGYTNLAEVKVTLPRKLISFVKTLEGKTFEQKLASFNTMIAEGKVDKRILTLVPFRIPTQLQNGIEAVEIKEFLSPTQANTMIVPNGITVKAGSDFDVDKLTSYIPHFAIKGKELVYVDKVIDSSELSKSINELKKDIDFAKLGQIRLLNKDTRAEDEITDEELGELFEIHSDVIEKAQPELKEKLADYNYLKMFTKKNLLENEIIDLSVDILTSKEVQGNLLTPDNTEQLQEASLKVINKLGLKKAFPKANNPNPLTNYTKLTFKNLIETRNALITFKSLVGQAALAATNHALAQKAELSYQNPDFNLYFAGYNNTTDDIFSLHNNYAGDDKISFLLKQFISASVDVSKENNDFIAYVNINNRTFGVVQTLIRMGVPVNTVFAFINQPILRDLQEKLEENNSVANLDRRSASEIEAEVARKYGSIQTYKDLKEGKASLNIFNEPSLDKMLKKDLSSAEKLNQLHILAQYNIYKQAADDVNNLQQAINVDTKQSGKSLAENFLRKLRLEEVKSSGKFINLDNLLYDTVLKQQQLSSDEVENLYTSLFKFSMHSTTPGKNLRNLYYETFSPILMSGDLLQGLERLDRFLTTFQILENGGVANYYKKLLVDGEAVLDLIKKKKQYKDNILLQQLVPMLPEEARATYNTKLFNKRYTLYEQENLIAGFRELMVKEPELAKKLIMQQLLQSGASLSQNSYQNILPEEYLALSKKALKTTTFTPEDVMRKFVLTHWKANELFKTKYIATSKGSELIELKVRQGTEFIRVKNRDKEMFFYQSTGETVGGKTLFVRVEPLGNYPWAINVKDVKAQPKTIIQAPKEVKSTAKSTVKRTNKTSFVEEEGYSTAETVDLGASPNTLKNTWLKLTMEQLKHLKSRNINNFGDFSTEVGIKESAGLSEEEAVETILSCK
jgi:hypothetical protein